MCGIAGFLATRPQAVRLSDLQRMTKLLAHRGPNDEGYMWANHSGQVSTASAGMRFPEEPGPWEIGLGHRRLSIIDLSQAGHQPMPWQPKSGTSPFWVTYNGEIYNYLELRQTLKEAGLPIQTETDTEVLLGAYARWGTEGLSRLNGMFAFALWDPVQKALFCARDRFGKKPFFYWYRDGLFLFASEMKALLLHPAVERRPNLRTIYRYLAYQFGFTDLDGETFFEGIHQLPPGHFLTVAPGRAPVVKRWWSMPPYLPQHGLSLDACADQMRQQLTNSVRLRLRSDVQIGVFLSGGLDSSSVSVLAAREAVGRRPCAFTSCFEDPAYDERQYAEAVAREVGFEWVPVFPQVSRLWETLPKMLWHLEEPVPNLNHFSQWCLMEAAAQKGCIVLLNGHGGDEGLNGYVKDWSFFFAELLQHLHWRTLVTEWSQYRAATGDRRALRSAVGLVCRRMVPLALKDWVVRRRLALSPFLQRAFVHRHANPIHFTESSGSFLADSSRMGYSLAPLPAWLRTEDRSSMAFGLESRSPFLDVDLVAWMSRLPAIAKMHAGQSKVVLRQALRGLLPEVVRTRSDKKGFMTPTDRWFRTDLVPHAEAIFRSEAFLSRGIFEPKGVTAMFQKHREGKVNLRFAIWSWINLELWFRMFIDPPRLTPVSDHSPTDSLYAIPSG